ncbi:MAG: hexose kinase [Chloroflexi bacterium]|uniref:1-phosphofructokinase family hexose kinase n=1 Tax=Candidatus Flexifilum breve TaxID=3140694 RepID=UPI003134FC53|nr:hexose kinase [Chloroflexota bacterium]
MIVTVTANTGIDYIAFVKELPRGKTIRATQMVESISGKPSDASWILGELGVTSHALGFSAGPNGDRAAGFLRDKGVQIDYVPVGGESRRNLILISEEGWQTAITTNSLFVIEEHLAQLRAKYIDALKHASVVVLGGTLPAGMTPAFYVDYIALARARGIPVIFDAAEPNLSAGLTSYPTIIKPNQDELSGLIGRPVILIDDAYQAGLTLYQQYGTITVTTLGAEGGLVVLRDRAYHIPIIPVPVVNAAGAGDAVLAGLAYALDKGLPIEDGLRVGFGAATATVTQPGTAQCTRDDVFRYAEQVQLIPYP